METNIDSSKYNLSEEEKRAQVERALELEQLEDREYQGTFRNDQASI